jgi:hypothetical protein
MFPFPIAKPQGCDIQTFYGSGTTAAKTWNKPTGVSHIYMMLIGAGGSGVFGSSGGGSGAVTVWYGAAQHVPQSLIVIPGTSGNTQSTRINLRLSNSAVGGTVILQAASGNGGSAGAAITAPVFASFGFYQSTAGQAGSAGSQTASATTFLSGGAYDVGDVIANYGYSSNKSGYFQMQPIIVGVGGSDTFNGGIGCGGGSGSTVGIGGQGMVLIASW